MKLAKRLSLFFCMATLFLSLLLVALLLFPTDNPKSAGDAPLSMRHSSLLRIVEQRDYTVVDVKNPWNDGVLQSYVLVPKGAELPDSLPEGVLLRTPLERVVLFSGVHALLFEELSAVASIAGVCDAQYIYSDAVREGLATGWVVDCGSSLDVDVERVVKALPEALFVLPYENGGYGKLAHSAVPLIECADYMEISPLGCAEWIRFYGRLLGCAAAADSIFESVCNEYEALALKAAACVERPRLMCELKSNSAWYVPGCSSTMGQMYADAGTDYIFSFCKGRGSVPLAFEVVLEKAAAADVWLVKYNSDAEKTYASLQGEFAGYSNFRPFKEKNIYACNTKYKRVFEECAFHPELLLKELVALFHPEVLPEYKLRYYEKMR